MATASLALPTGTVEIPIVGSPALDLFDPANPDPTYIPPNKRFSTPGQGEPALPAHLDNPDAITGLPPSLLDLPKTAEGFDTTASPSAGNQPTASASTPAERAVWPMLSPSLIRGADFAAAKLAAAEEAPTSTLEGHLIPEEQPLGRRSIFRRWAIQTTKNERFPLTSNLTVLQAVKQKGILDIKVSITGRWAQAKGEARLKFFIADTVRPMEELPNAGAGKNPHDTRHAPSQNLPAEKALAVGGFASAPLGKAMASEAVIIPPPKR